MSSNNPLVSIITPTFNQEKFIEQTIKSVLSQTYKNVEYIVINDGSTDATASILSSLTGNFRIINQENMGQAKTLNSGWQLCRGKYIGYLSSDDILYPKCIEEIVKYLEADDNLVCVFPDADLIDENSKVIKKRICREFSLVDTLVTQECHVGPGALFKKSAFDLLGGWNTKLKLAPDREFWIRISELGEIKMLDAALAGYRIHPKSISYDCVSEATSLEYIYVLDNYFKNDSVPVCIKEKKAEAYGYAYLILARNCFRDGSYLRGIAWYKKACTSWPKFRSFNTILKLLRNIISKPTRVVYSRCVQLIKKA